MILSRYAPPNILMNPGFKIYTPVLFKIANDVLEHSALGVSYRYPIIYSDDAKFLGDCVGVGIVYKHQHKLDIMRFITVDFKNVYNCTYKYSGQSLVIINKHDDQYITDVFNTLMNTVKESI